MRPEAREDVFQIGQYTQQHWGAVQRVRCLGHIEAAFHDLQAGVAIGQNRSEMRTGLMSLPCQTHLIFYRVQGDTVEVLRILHRRIDLEAQF